MPFNLVGHYGNWRYPFVFISQYMGVIAFIVWLIMFLRMYIWMKKKHLANTKMQNEM